MKHAGISVAFLLLASPTFVQLLQGDLDLFPAALRCLVALVVAIVGVSALAALLTSYAPEEPADEPVPTRRETDQPQAA